MCVAQRPLHQTPDWPVRCGALHSIRDGWSVSCDFWPYSADFQSPRYEIHAASPEFYWEGAPRETKTFVLILRDPDAPRTNGFTHWLLHNIPPNITRISENLSKQNPAVDRGPQGKNDSGKLGYIGPCPPSGRHRYFARLYALRKELDLPPGASPMEVRVALRAKSSNRWS